MLSLIIATIAILLSVAVTLASFYAEREQPIDERIIDSYSYWWYLPM